MTFTSHTEPLEGNGVAGHLKYPRGESHQSGLLMINADDSGRDRETTDRIFDCVVRGTVTSASAMVFMEDSERAAAIAKERGVDAGLHINFTTPFSAPNAPDRLKERHQKIAAFLVRRRLNQIIFHPGLASSFESRHSSTNGRVLPSLWRTTRKTGWTSPHASLRQRRDGPITAPRNHCAAEFLVSARREECVEPFLSQGYRQESSPAAPSHRLPFLAATARTA